MKESIFTDADIISTYTIEDALADRTLYDARKLPGKAGEMSREKYKGSPVYLTVGLHGLIERAVENPRASNDWPGVWWDVLWMSTPAVNRAAREAQKTGYGRSSFKVTINGAGRYKNHEIIVALNGDGLTFMMPDEE